MKPCAFCKNEVELKYAQYLGDGLVACSQECKRQWRKEMASQILKNGGVEAAIKSAQAATDELNRGKNAMDAALQLTRDSTAIPEYCSVCGSELHSTRLYIEGGKVLCSRRCLDELEAQESATQSYPELLLDKCKTILRERGEQRDSLNGERSMGKMVETFNALCDADVTEIGGWMFMVILKLTRMQRGKFNEDDYLDAINYIALAAEARKKLQRDFK